MKHLYQVYSFVYAVKTLDSVAPCNFLQNHSSLDVFLLNKMPSRCNRHHISTSVQRKRFDVGKFEAHGGWN